METILFLSTPTKERHPMRWWPSLLLVIAGYLLFTLALTYPAVLHLSDLVIGDGGDNYQFLAFQYVGNQQFRDGQLPFGWTNIWRYPVGFDFAGSYDSTLLIMIGVLLYPIFSNPALVYNLSLIGLVVLNCTLSYIFFAWIVQSRWYGFIGGAIFGASFYVLARLGGHPNLILIGCFPFFLYSLLQLRERRVDTHSCLLLMVATLLIFLSSLQHLLLVSGSLLFIIPITYLFYPRYITEFAQLLWEKWRQLVLPVLGVLAVFLFFHNGKIFSMLHHDLILPAHDIVTVPPINYLTPNKYLRALVTTLGINQTREWIEYVVFLGYVERAIGLIYLALTDVTARFKGYLLTIMGVIFLIGLGGNLTEGTLMPYPYLYEIFPFRGIVEPARFSIVIILILTLMVCWVLQRLSPRYLWISGVVLALVILERLPVKFFMTPTLANQAFIPVVQATKADAVLDLPVFQEWWNGQYYDMYAIYYDKPIVNGYIHWLGDTPQSHAMLARLKRFACSTDPAFEAKTFTEEEIALEKEDNRNIGEMLRRYHISTIVFHKDYSIDARGCEDVVYRLPIFLHESGIPIHKIYEDEKKEVYVLE